MKKSRAAEIWASLEKRLIERCGLPNGRMLEVNRPYLIRWIGERLKGVPVDVMATAGDTVSPPLRLDDSQPANTATRHLPHLRNLLDDSGPALAFKSTKTVGHNHAAVGRKSPDTIHDPKLAAMLERACSLRGYDPDDSVSY